LPNAPKILAVRVGRAGDLIMITPALRALRQAYSQARIDVLVRRRYRELLEGNPHLTGLVFLDDENMEKDTSHTVVDLRMGYTWRLEKWEVKPFFGEIGRAHV